MSGYYATPTAPNRRRNRLSRTEYQSRRTEFAARGQGAPGGKLTDLEVISIRSAHRQRVNLVMHIKMNLSNEALAKQFGVHVRSIEKIISRETWTHLP